MDLTLRTTPIRLQHAGRIASVSQEVSHKSEVATAPQAVQR